MSKGIFAGRLKKAMGKQGKKQVDLIRIASERGVKLGKSHISQYVSGKTIPRGDILHFLAEVLQVDENWLKGASDEASEPLPGLKPEELTRSEERRVGKECRSRWSPYH